MDLMCKVIFLEWLLPLLLERIKGWSQFIHGNSAIPEFVCLRKIEIGGFLCHYCEVLLKQQTNIILLFWLPLQVLRKQYSKKGKCHRPASKQPEANQRPAVSNMKQLQETSFQNHVCPTISLRDDHWPVLF